MISFGRGKKHLPSRERLERSAAGASAVTGSHPSGAEQPVAEAAGKKLEYLKCKDQFKHHIITAER